VVFAGPCSSMISSPSSHDTLPPAPFSNMILIDRSMTYTQKRCTLVHELIHWQHADNTRTGV
ncbi:hypothetical protein J3T92_06630, partial [Bifidobacterium sp. B4081]|nr:hypothetical protein [Bifidobacterium sp. B4081]MCX8648327.1 hypothetical protein [Bifidobacterium sp. B4107]MCX8658955.1 hypothetical protein [Bifidobacterium sp. B4114]